MMTSVAENISPYYLVVFFKGKLGRLCNITALNNQLCHRLIYYIISYLGL